LEVPTLAKILIVDDEQSVLEVLRIVMRSSGYEVLTASSEEAARHAFIADEPDLVLQDLHMIDAQSGLRLLNHFRKHRPQVPVIVITGHSSWDSTLMSMQEGAYDFMKKPFDNESVREVVARALSHSRSLQSSDGKFSLSSEILGNTVSMRAVMATIERVAKTDSTVLITGESGTGKELVARALHYCSNRSHYPFISVNSCAFPANLLETELFGHVKGAFSGALNTKKGLLEIADQGTFFFDEIGDLPMSMQVKLLRILEEQKFFPVGGTKPKQISVRFIGATNKDLDTLIASGKFREDLYYRLNVIPISLPPLRERKDDIMLIASHFVAKFARELERNITGVSPEARAELEAYNWPGNVRELQNTIERSVALSRGTTLTKVNLQARRFDTSERFASPRSELPRSSPRPQPPPNALGDDLRYTLESGSFLQLKIPSEGIKLEKTMSEIERAYLESALLRTSGHVTNAAKLLGITFRSMRYKVQKYDLKSNADS
jgi:DNA-binding NtrC family response regulator